MRIQWLPNIAGPRRLCLTRLRWESRDEFGREVSNKISVSVMAEPRDAWVGVYWKTRWDGFEAFACLLPFFPIRVCWRKSWSGRFP